MARVLVPLAAGFEEIEAVTIIDLLRRAGVEVVVAGLQPGPVTGSHQITVTPDLDLDDAVTQTFDMVALPGGMPGADNLQRDHRIIDVLQATARRGGFTAAICAAPKVLAAAGLLDHRCATSYPGFLDAGSAPGITLSEKSVVQDGSLLTSRGPGTAMDFALALIENLAGEDQRDAVETGLQRPATIGASNRHTA